VTIPANTSELNITISGGSGDADLYVRYNDRPEARAFDCRPYRNGNEDSCKFTAPQSGTWYIGMHAFRAFNEVTLEVSVT